MKIEINEEDIFNLRIAEKKLIATSEPYVDLEVFTIRRIIEDFEKKEID